MTVVWNEWVSFLLLHLLQLSCFSLLLQADLWLWMDIWVIKLRDIIIFQLNVGFIENSWKESIGYFHPHRLVMHSKAGDRKFDFSKKDQNGGWRKKNVCSHASNLKHKPWFQIQSTHLQVIFKLSCSTQKKNFHTISEQFPKESHKQFPCNFLNH